MPEDWPALSARLGEALHLTARPVAITFGERPPDGLPSFDAPFPEPTPDGRTGRVAAGCVFWVHGADATFTTAPEDHGNCSVGSFTHGIKTLAEAATGADVATLVEAGWVTEEDFGAIPSVSEQPGSISYGPLDEMPVDPDVVLLRLQPQSVMVLSDALPGLRVEGKPQCHIVALAKEHGEVAASVGCALSRARTGMKATEMTCAVPAGRLAEVVERVEAVADTDAAVARYASRDALRFGPRNPDRA